MLQGIDAYSGNSESDFDAGLAQSAFVILKATEGVTWPDPSTTYGQQVISILRKRTQKVRSAGKLLGFYHFAHPQDDWKRQAEWFYEIAQMEPGEFPFWDVEVTDGVSWSQIGPGVATGATRLAQLCGVPGGFYSYLSYIDSMMGSISAAARTAVTNMPLWIADPGSPAGSPRHPFWSVWTVDQYGIVGGLDRNVFNGDAATWAKLAIPVPSPGPAPVPSPVQHLFALREYDVARTFLVRRSSDGAWFTVPEDLAFKHHIGYPSTLSELQNNPDYEVPNPMWSDNEINAIPDAPTT